MKRFTVSFSRLPAASTLLLLVISGCYSKSTVTTVTPAVARASRRTTPVAARATASVQTLPLYRQAEAACSRKQYRQAAGLLARLAADPRLSPQERHFCQEQRAICLKDAGLPVPALRSVPAAAPSLPVAATSPPLSPEQADCGPRALQVVCGRLGVKTLLPTLRQMAGTTREGTSMEGLAEAAQRLGLKTEGVQVSREALSRVEMPAVAWVNQNHYIAVLYTNGEGETAMATVRDPNRPGEETMPQEQLLRLCGGYLLLVHR